MLITPKRVVLLGAGPISTFASSYRALAFGQCLVEDQGADVHFVISDNADDQRTFGGEHKGVRLHYLSDLPILLTGWRFDPQLLLRALVRTWRRSWAVWRLKPDVVHVFKPLPETLLAGFVLKLLGYKVVLDVDDAEADIAEVTGHAARDFWRHRVTRLLGRIGHRMCQHVTVGSRAFESLYRDRGAAVTYAPNGIFIDDYADPAFAPKPPRGEVTVMYLGALERWYDADLAVEAFAAAHERLPGLHLIVVGDGPTLPELKAQARALGCGEAVDFVGRVPKADMVQWLTRADIYLFPMRRNWTNESRCPMKVREFAAMGRPIVGPAFGEVLEGAVCKEALVDADASAQDYAEKLAAVAQDLLEGRLRLDYPPPLERFDWRLITRGLAEAYGWEARDR